MELPNFVMNTTIQNCNQAVEVSHGRPQKPFENCSVKTKRRRVQELIMSRSPEELSFAASISPRASQSNAEGGDKIIANV